MEISKNFEKLPWCKNWSMVPLDEDGQKELFKKCFDMPRLEILGDVQEIIKKSRDFPIPFPINTVRLEVLLKRRPIERLKKNIASTYPIIHERILFLMTRFLNYKRQYATSIEKDFYKDMTVADLIDRILKKRAINFMGPRDKYKLLSGESGQEGWELVGTSQETPPLVLENCLSYDEMKLASMVYVSGFTECINDGTRNNQGVVKEDGIEENAVIIGIIGPRFKRKNRMEFEDVVISEHQNTIQNGYGERSKNNQSAKSMWRKMWEDFYDVHNICTYEELKLKFSLKDKPEEVQHRDRYVKIPRSKNIFDNEVYYKRICITAECALLEAEGRAKDEGKYAFLNIIGAGLGVWRIASHQNDVYVLTLLERLRSFLQDDNHMLDHVSDVNLAYIKPNSSIEALFTNIASLSGEPKPKQLFLESKSHPKGGIKVFLENRNPSSKLTGEHEGKLLVMTYAWDGNSHPGNEFWIGKLASSGDPAAACSTQVAELHNAHINSAVTANNTRVVGRHGRDTIQNAALHLANLFPD